MENCSEASALERVAVPEFSIELSNPRLDWSHGSSLQFSIELSNQALDWSHGSSLHLCWDLMEVRD